MGSRTSHNKLRDVQTDQELIRVLVADANAREATTVRNALKSAPTNFAVSPARRLWSATQILAGMSIDAVLLSLDLPDGGGANSDSHPRGELSALFALQNEVKDVPVLILGGDPERGAKALKAGADDFLLPEDYAPDTLRRRILEAIERRRPAPTAPAASQSTPNAASMRVLLVEEDALVQRLLQRNLVRKGHRIEVLDSPQEAIAWVQQANSSLDLLICDVHPAAMDGARLSRHLRRNFPTMRTLLFSSGAGVPDAVLDEPDYVFYLPKPYALSDFESIIGEIERLKARPNAFPPQPANQATPTRRH
jgi:DNA-binding response OmpR family regulator